MIILDNSLDIKMNSVRKLLNNKKLFIGRVGALCCRMLCKTGRT